MIYIDSSILKINISVRQSAKLGNTKPRSKQNDKLVIILVTDLIAFNKEKRLFSCIGERGTFGSVSYLNDCNNLKVKEIFPDTVIMNRCIEGCPSENACDY